MKQLKLSIGILLAASMFTGCGALAAPIAGASMGAVIGALAGDAGAGAMIGAAVFLGGSVQ